MATSKFIDLVVIVNNKIRPRQWIYVSNWTEQTIKMIK